MPPRDATADASPTLNDNSEDTALISVEISGDASAVAEARSQIVAIVASRVAKVSTKIDSIPRDYWSLLGGAGGSSMTALVDRLGYGESVTVVIPKLGAKVESKITVNGEREGVAAVVKAIQAEYEELVRCPSSLLLPSHPLAISTETDGRQVTCRDKTRRPSPSRSTNVNIDSSPEPTPMRSSKRVDAPLSCHRSRTRRTSSSQFGVPSRLWYRLSDS